MTVSARRAGLYGVVALWLAASPAEGSVYEDLLFETYVAFGALAWSYEEPDLEEAKGWGGRITGGVLFTDNLGIEAHFAQGGDETVDFGRTRVEFEGLDSVMLRLNAPFYFVHTYALAGFSVADMAIIPEDMSLADSPSASGFSYGLGLELRTPESYALTADYIRYLSDSGFHFEASSVSLKWRF